MKIKTFLICWLPAFAVMFSLNGLFHVKLAAAFFDTQLGQLRPAIHPMHEADPLWVGLLDLVLSFGMAYFITLRAAGKLKLGTAAFSGGLLNLVSAGAWNFANAAMFSWSLSVTLGDIAWHVGLGLAVGLMIASVYNRIAPAGR